MNKNLIAPGRLLSSLIILILTASLTGLAPEAMGQATYIWTGAIDNDWQNPGNWNPARNPLDITNNDTLIFDGVVGDTIYNIPRVNIDLFHVLGNSDFAIELIHNNDPIISGRSGRPGGIIVEAGSALTVLKGRLRLTVGQRNTAEIYGKIIIGAGGALNTGDQLEAFIFKEGSEYVHVRPGGSMARCIWEEGSTAIFRGLTTATPVDFEKQEFANLVWECGGQKATLGALNLSGTIKGDFTVLNTGGQALVLRDSTEVHSLLIEGDYYQNTGTGNDNTQVVLSSGLGDFSLTVNGDFVLDDSNFAIARGGNSNSVLSVSGDFSFSGSNKAKFILAESGLTGELNVAGDFSFTQGTIGVNGNGTGDINFNGTEIQRVTSGGTYGGVNFTVKEGASLEMGTPNAPAVLGGASFTLEDGATLIITSTAGIALSSANGNIQTSARSYSPAANYVYLNTGNTGNGLPTSTISGDISIASGATVSTSNSISCDATIEVNGTLNPGITHKISGLGSIEGSGTLKVTGRYFSEQYDIATKDISDMTVDYAASGGGHTVSALTYNNLMFSNTTGSNNVDGNIIVTGTLTNGTGTLNVGTYELYAASLVNNGLIEVNSTLGNNGSLIVDNVSGAGSVTYTRQLRMEANNGDFHYVASPVLSNTVLNAEKVDTVFSYNEVTNRWVRTGMTALSSGKGYNLRQTPESDGRIVFSGGLLTGLQSVFATSPYSDTNFGGVAYESRTYASGRDDGQNYGGGGWNLLGNPYTAAINAGSFVEYNEDSFDPNYKAVYIYDATVGDRGVYRYVGGEVPGQVMDGASGQTHVQAGQGFFVLAMYNGAEFVFSPSMRSHSRSTPMAKSANEPWPGLKLKVGYGTNERSTVVVFNEEMKPGLDPGYDVGQLSTFPAVEIYTRLAGLDNGVNFARQALPMAGYDEYPIPVGIDSEKGGPVTFSADIVPIPGYKFYLEDKLLGSVVDLHESAYTVNIAPQTYGTGRFYILTSTGMITGTESPDDNILNIRVWTSGNVLTIDGEVSDKASVAVYDLTGRKLTDRRLAGGYYNTLTLPQTAPGILLVKVSDGMRVFTTKVIQ